MNGTLDEVIARRKSVRAYTGAAVPSEAIKAVLTAGSLAPSGKNGQPLRFIVVQKDKRLLCRLAELTLYESFVKTADALLFVFLDKAASYHYVKDAQAAGACVENMLLKCADLGLGACWIGEILNRDIFVKRALCLDNALDLMAAVAIGWPDEAGDRKQPRKKPLDALLIRYL